MRTIQHITTGFASHVGPLTIHQPLPVSSLRIADPFLLLHHAGPQRFDPTDEVPRIDAHPHKGFEPVTFVFDGTVLHRDSLGNTGIIGANEVQWITSGSGIIHEEGPTPELARSGGSLELVQLWINLPASKKLMKPAYQELHSEILPHVTLLDGAVQARVVAGEWGGQSGPAVTQTPLTAVMGTMMEGGSGILPLPAYETVLLYILGGSVTIDGHHVHEHQLIQFDNKAESTEVAITVDADVRFLLLGGRPINEPVVSYGPFVMNTEDEIRTAFNEYASGAYGQV